MLQIYNKLSNISGLYQTIEIVNSNMLCHYFMFYFSVEPSLSHYSLYFPLFSLHPKTQLGLN